VQWSGYVFYDYRTSAPRFHHLFCCLCFNRLKGFCVSLSRSVARLLQRGFNFSTGKGRLLLNMLIHIIFPARSGTEFLLKMNLALSLSLCCHLTPYFSCNRPPLVQMQGWGKTVSLILSEFGGRALATQAFSCISSSCSGLLDTELSSLFNRVL